MRAMGRTFRFRIPRGQAHRAVLVVALLLSTVLAPAAAAAVGADEIGGVVLDGDGQPLVGGCVYVHEADAWGILPGWNGAYVEWADIHTQVDGSFLATGLEPGRDYKVQVRDCTGPDASLSETWYGGAFTHATAAPVGAGTDGLVIQMAPGGRVTVNVHAPDGSPHGGICMWLYQPGTTAGREHTLSVVTAIMGYDGTHAAFNGIRPGPVEVLVFDRPWEYFPYGDCVAHEIPINELVRAGTYEVVAGQTTAVDIEYVYPARITGTVTLRGSGAPVTPCIYLEDLDGVFSFAGQGEPDGTYDLRVNPGQYRLLMQACGDSTVYGAWWSWSGPATYDQAPQVTLYNDRPNAAMDLQLNAGPVGRDVAASTPVGTPVDLDLASVMSDANGDGLRIVLDPPSVGSADVSGTIVTFTPPAGFTGIATIRYELHDDHGGIWGSHIRVAVGEGWLAQDVGPGGTVSTGTVATATDPLQTAVTLPAGGAVLVQPTQVVDQAPSGYSFLGVQVQISATPGSSLDPLILTFTVDESLMGGLTAADVIPFRNGQPVADCYDGVVGAAPDPCVDRAATEIDADGDLVMVVRTSQASTWNLGAVSSTPVRASALVAAPVAVGRPASVAVTLTSSSAITQASITVAGVSHAAVAVDGSFGGTTEQVRVDFVAPTSTGLYDVCVDAVAEPTCTQLPVYDPTGSFTTGGGWAQTAQGRVDYGFVAKYHPNSGAPTGEASLRWSDGRHVEATRVEWLVVTADGRARMHGTALYQGEPCVFTLDSWDGSLNGADAVALEVNCDGASVGFGPIRPAGGNIRLHR